jgi:hypothetical protein
MPLSPSTSVTLAEVGDILGKCEFDQSYFILSI